MTEVSKKFAAAILFLLLSACTAGSAISNLEAGMTPAQVDEVMGKPDGQTVSGIQIIKRYTNRFVPFDGPNAANYAAVFENGRLVEWGLESRNSTAWNNTQTFVIWQ